MSPTFPPDASKNYDLPHLDSLNDVEYNPVFILGLHRSGTTFLYDTLGTVLPVGVLTAHDILYYRELLANHHAGRTEEARRALDDGFKERGLATRDIDHVSVTSTTVEEYGFLLGKELGEHSLTDHTAPLLDEMCRKLSVMNPAARAVLLKNPWDIGHTDTILRHFPNARFVLISREPVRILQSQVRAGLVNSSTPVPYLMMLLERFPQIRFRLYLKRVLYRLLGQKTFERLLVRVTVGSMVRELALLEQARNSLDPDRFIHVTYEELTENPAETIGQIANFLEMKAEGVDRIEPRTRTSPLRPMVSKWQARLSEKIQSSSGALQADVSTP